MHERGLFVGRAKELTWLRAAFERALGGFGGVAMVTGEAGVGKTRLMRELERYALKRGALVLWGEAREAGGASPYQPWEQALQGLVAAPDWDTLRADLGGDGGEVARIAPGLRGQLPEPRKTEASQEPNGARFQLYGGVTSFLKTVSTATPLVLVLDDLHWADEATLQLVAHTAHELARSRVLLVCSYRAREIGVGGPLDEAVVELARSERSQTIPLNGLSRSEVRSYLTAVTETEPGTETVDLLFRSTDGNPFFLHEIVALLVQAGCDEVPRELPASVRAAIGRRLNGVSERCRELLSAAAVAGRDFRYELLAAIDRPRSSEGIDCLESALAAGLIDETLVVGEYRFTHALVQESLFEALSSARRAELHGRIGTALESLLGDSAEEQAAELAYHFVEAALLDEGKATKALDYAALAAEQAEARYAMHDAARIRRAALELVQRSRPLLGEHEAPLLAALAAADSCRGASQSGAENYVAAISLFRKQQRYVEAAAATLEVLYHYDIFEVVHLGPLKTTRYRLASDALAGLGDADPRLRARLLAELVAESSSAEDDELVSEARALATEHRLVDVDARLARRSALQALSESGGTAFRDWMMKSKQQFHDAGDMLSAMNTWCVATTVPVARGHLDEAHIDIDGLVAFAGEHGFSGQVTASLATRAFIALARDERSRYQELIATMPLSARQSAPRALVEAFRAELAGDVGTARQLLDEIQPESASPKPWLAGARARLALVDGDEHMARAEFAAWDAYQRTPSATLQPVGHLGEGALLASRGRRTKLLDEATTQMGVRYFAGRSTDWIRGVLALSLDRLDEAEGHFEIGLSWCERERCFVEMGRNLQGLAEVAARQGRRSEALKRLEAACEQFERHDAPLLLDAARTLAAEVRATPLPGRSEHPDGLTEREMEVLQLLVHGRRNKAIAEELSISPRTAGHHVANILRKTGASNRTEAASYAAARGLVASDAID